MSYRIPIKTVNSTLTYIFDKVSNFTENVIIDKFTKLGSDAPALKFKELTGTTGANQGDITLITHNVTESKILGVSIHITNVSNVIVPPNYTYSSTNIFNYYVNGGNIGVVILPGESADLVSRPIKVLISYKE